MTLVRNAGASKCYFASPFGVDNERTGNTGKVAPRRSIDDERPTCTHERAYRGFLPYAQLQDCDAVRGQAIFDLVNDRAVGVQAIHPAIKRKARIMIAYFGRQYGQVGVRDIRRIGNNQVESSA
jgi:hypothetical protein